jgi:hypothetical protein
MSHLCQQSALKFLTSPQWQHDHPVLQCSVADDHVLVPPTALLVVWLLPSRPHKQSGLLLNLSHNAACVTCLFEFTLDSLYDTYFLFEFFLAGAYILNKFLLNFVLPGAFILYKFLIDSHFVLANS